MLNQQMDLSFIPSLHVLAEVMSIFEMAKYERLPCKMRVFRSTSTLSRLGKYDRTLYNS